MLCYPLRILVKLMSRGECLVRGKHCHACQLHASPSGLEIQLINEGKFRKRHKVKTRQHQLHDVMLFSRGEYQDYGSQECDVWFGKQVFPWFDELRSYYHVVV
jgi:hypothetical protein